MDPHEPDRERKIPVTYLDESIRRRLPQAAPPPEPPAPEPPPGDTAPARTVRRPLRRSPGRGQVTAALYLLTVLVLFFVVVRYIISTELDDETLVFFGLPLLAIGYLAREIVAVLEADRSPGPPPGMG